MADSDGSREPTLSAELRKIADYCRRYVPGSGRTGYQVTSGDSEHDIGMFSALEKRAAQLVCRATRRRPLASLPRVAELMRWGRGRGSHPDTEKEHQDRSWLANLMNIIHVAKVRQAEDSYDIDHWILWEDVPTDEDVDRHRNRGVESRRIWLADGCLLLADLIDACEKAIDQDGVSEGGNRSLSVQSAGDSSQSVNTEQKDTPSTLPGSPSKIPERVRLAWQLKNIMGIKTQVEIAKIMSDELKVPIHQGSVSKYLKQAAELARRGLFPVFRNPDAKKTSLDPKVLDLGKRQDGISEHQREKRSPS